MAESILERNGTHVKSIFLALFFSMFCLIIHEYVRWAYTKHVFLCQRLKNGTNDCLGDGKLADSKRDITFCKFSLQNEWKSKWKTWLERRISRIDLCVCVDIVTRANIIAIVLGITYVFDIINIWSQLRMNLMKCFSLCYDICYVGKILLMKKIDFNFHCLKLWLKLALDFKPNMTKLMLLWLW